MRVGEVVILSQQAREIEHSLRSQRAPELFPRDVASEFVLPDYDGRSLANVPATLAKLLGVTLSEAASPLRDVYWRDLAQGVHRVVLVLLDALGYMQLTHMLQQEPGSVWERLATRGLLLPMTSVFPSTTTTALATLSTGTEPIVHGLLGYELWLREYAVLTEMLSLKPAFGTGKETLLDWGFVPEDFLPVPTIGTMLSQVKVNTTSLVPAQHTRGALTRMCYRGFKRVLGYTNAVGMWSLAHHALTHDDAEKSFYFLYWGAIDSAIHTHGSADGAWQARYREVSRACDEHFLSRLTSEQRRGTLLIMCADHGFVDSPAELAHDTEANPVLHRELLIPYSGEARAAYLHCVNGEGDETLRRLQEGLGSAYLVIRTRDAVRAGLFGRACPGPESLARLGHFVVVSREEHYLDRQDKRTILRGRHGGLSPQEMLVPWLAARLDA